MAKVWDKEITVDTDWGGDASTGGLPVSGRQIQSWIKANIKTDDQLRVFLVENGYGTGSGEVSQALVAIEGEQNITGLKNFANGLKIYGLPFKYDASQGGLLFEGGFSAKGGFFSNAQRMYFDTAKGLWVFTKGVSVLGSISSNNMPLVYDTAKQCWVFTESISTPKSLIINEAPITYDKDKKCWVFTGDVLVSGGLATFSNIAGFNPSTIMDGIKVDGSSISKEKGFLEVKSSVGASSIMEGLVVDGTTLKKVTNDAGVLSLAINTDNPQSYIPVDGQTIKYDEEKKYFKVIGGGSSGGVSGGVSLEQLQEILKGYVKTDGAVRNPSALYWKRNPETDLYYTEWYDGSDVKYIDLPTSLKNPYALEFAGGASGSYDGSSKVTINIPTSLPASDVSSWAKAATKPSYTYTEISNTPTSLPNPSALSWSGYNTGSYDGSAPTSFVIPSKVSQLTNDNKYTTETEVNNKLANYLPKSGGTISGSLSITGDLQVGGHIASLVTSDERLKENIRTFSATEILQSMGGVKQYEYTEDEVKRNPSNAGTHIGFIYQNVEKSQMADKMCVTREDGYGALNYLSSDYQALLAAVILEQAEEIKKLKGMLNSKTA